MSRRVATITAHHSAAHPASPSRALARPRRAPDGLTLGLALLVVGWAVLFAWLAVVRHLSGGSHAEDLGFTDQVIANFLRGQWFRMSVYAGASTWNTELDLSHLARPDSLLAFHVEPMLLLFVPLYAAGGGVVWLLVIQAVAVALGAVPAFLLARRWTGTHSRWVGAAAAGAYLLSPLGQWAVLSDFHTSTIAAPVLLLAVERLSAGRLGTSLAAAVLALSAREDVGPVLVGLGLLAGVGFKRRRFGLLLGGLGLGWTAVCLLVLRSYSGGSVSPFSERYVSLLANGPAAVVAALARPADVGYLGTWLLSGGWLGILAPLALAPSLPSLALNLLSSSPWMASGRAHYSGLVLPFVVVAACAALGSLPRRVEDARTRRVPTAAPAGCAGCGPVLAALSLAGRGPRPVLAALSVALCGLTSAVRALSGARPGLTAVLAALLILTSGLAYLLAGAGPLAADYAPATLTEHARLANALAASLPETAAVSASASLVPHVSRRARVYVFPAVLDADALLIDVTAPAPTSAGDVYLHVRDLLADGGWRLAAAADGLLLLERAPDAPPLAVADLPPPFLSFVRPDPPPGGSVDLPPRLLSFGPPDADLPPPVLSFGPPDGSEAGGPGSSSVVAGTPDGLELTQASLVPAPDGAIEPDGPRGILRTTWRVDRQPSPGASLQFELSLSNGETLRVWDVPGVWWYPPERWMPGEIVTIDVPNVPRRQFRSWQAVLSGF